MNKKKEEDKKIIITNKDWLELIKETFDSGWIDSKGEVMKVLNISLAVIGFNCPFCQKEYYDEDEKYLKRINKNKCGYTKIKCDCGKIFGVAYNYKGLVSFDLKSKYMKFVNKE